MTQLGAEGLPLLPKGWVTMVKATPAYAVKNVDLVRIVMLKSNRADRNSEGSSSGNMRLCKTELRSYAWKAQAANTVDHSIVAT